MVQRLPSDHDDVETHRVPIERIGRTDRPEVTLPSDLDVAAGDGIRLALDGENRHGAVDTSMGGDPVVRWVADNARMARERDGTNRLAEWIRESDNDPGQTVHLDVVTPGYAFGLRTPGTTVVYDAAAPPDASLADIARSLDE